MSIIPRPTLALDPKPMLLWTEVPDARFYQFSMRGKNTNEVLWEKSLDVAELPPAEDGFLKCDYPDVDKPLNVNDIYVLNAQACAEKSLLKQQEIEVILLDESARNIVGEFESLLSLDKEPLGNLEKKWLMAREVITIFRADPARAWGRVCMRVIFD